MTPFLSIITRHVVGREKLLQRNILSVQTQTCSDYEQIFLIDEECRGMLWADRNLHAQRHRPTGQYIYVLDDDDYLVDNEFVEKARDISNTHSPDVIAVKMRRTPLHPQVLPEPQYWKQAPTLGHIGTPNFVVKREVWVEHIHRFGAPGDQYSDYHFIRAIWDAGHSFHWLDRIVTEVDRIGHL